MSARFVGSLLALVALLPSPASAQTLTLGSPTQPAAASVAAGAPQALVGRLTLAASGGSVTVTELRLGLTGTAGPVCPLCGQPQDVQRLFLFQDNDASGTITGPDTLVGIASWNATLGRYQIPYLAFTVNSGATVTLLAGATISTGATTNDTLALSVGTADVLVASPATMAGTAVAGSTFTLTAGPTAGDATAGSLKPQVAIINPANGALVAGTAKVQVQVYSPGGTSTVSSVQVSTDGGATWPTTLSQNTRYNLGTYSGVWDGTVTVSPGGVALRAQATDTSARVGTSALVMVGRGPAAGDGKLLVRDNSSELCIDCHAMQVHSSEATDNKYGSWTTTCRDCHTPHRTPNIYVIRKSITPPPVNGYQSSKATKFSTTTGDSNTTSVSLASFANSDNTGPCQVCHTRTASASGTARWRNTGNSDTHYTAAAGTQACTGCHAHTQGFKPGESKGSTDCSSCHANLFQPMAATTGGNHHVLNNAWSGSTQASGTTTYPTAALGGASDTNRRCLFCHVDHNIFRPDLNANNVYNATTAPNAGRGANLRTAIGVTPSATSAPSPTGGYDNADYDPASSGGICTSCHGTALTKAYPQPDGTTTTPAVDPTAFGGSAHNYTASSTFKDGSQFRANCSKCHNDTIGKSKQTSAYPNQFGLHDSKIRRMGAPMGDNWDSGTASAFTATSITDGTKAWTPSAWAGHLISITDASGTRSAYIKDNDATNVYGLDAFSPAPSGTVTYVIGDPPELRTCLNCHSGGVAGNDYYGVKAMNASERRFDQFEKFYAAGTISAPAPSGSYSWSNALATTTVTGTSTTWSYTGASATFTNGSNTVNGIGTAWNNSMLGWRICVASGAPVRCTASAGGTTPINSSQSIVWYTIVAVNSPTQVTVSPSFQEATTTSAWEIAIGDWFLQCDADANQTWYKILDVASSTSLIVFPAYPAACSGTYMARSSPGHPKRPTPGVHRPGEGTAPGAWNSGSKRHVTCADCHNNHAVQATGPHTPGLGTLAGPTVGTWGVQLSYPASKTGTANFGKGSQTVTWVSGAQFAASDVGANLVGPDNVVYPITGYSSATSISIGSSAVGYKSSSPTSGAFTISYPKSKNGSGTFTNGSTCVTAATGQLLGSADQGSYLIGPDGFTYTVAGTFSDTACSVACTSNCADFSLTSGFVSPTITAGFYVKERAKTGFANYTGGSTSVTWVSGDQWSSADVGKSLSGPDGKVYTVSAVPSATTLTLGSAYSATTNSGAFVVSDVGYTVVQSLTTSNYQFQMCIKCHSPMAYGQNVPTTNFFSYNSTSYWAMGATEPQSDIAWDFNPAQLAHHAVMGPGNNQPPDNANPAWAANAAGTKASTYSWTDQFGTVHSATNPNAGLDNNFVDGWGKKSRVACDDCHRSSSADDPWGPHGSANQWILRGIDPTVTVTINNGSGGTTVVTPNNCYYKGSTSSLDGVPDTGDRKNICLNCHRADVYGMLSYAGSTTGSSCNGGTTLGANIPYANFARVTHPADARAESNGVATAASSSALTRYGIFCMQCHGGASLSTIHGTNNGVGAGGGSYLGKRFLAGAVWSGVTRAGTTQLLTCWTKGRADNVSTCTHLHSGSTNNRYANYDYDSGGD